MCRLRLGQFLFTTPQNSAYLSTNSHFIARLHMTVRLRIHEKLCYGLQDFADGTSIFMEVAKAGHLMQTESVILETCDTETASVAYIVCSFFFLVFSPEASFPVDAHIFQAGRPFSILHGFF